MEELVLNKKGLAEAVAKECDLTKKKSEEVINAVFAEISKTLSEKGSVDIYGFGKFDLSHREERQGINPATKEKITIKASDSVRFKASKSLKSAVNK